MLPTNKISAMLLSAVFVPSLLLNLMSLSALAGEVSEDRLNTEKALGWGGEGLPFDDSLTIRDPLVNSVVGKVTIDRHGEDNTDQNALLGLFGGIRSPFAGPMPGRMTIVTFWSSKEEGCSVKASIHDAPKSGSSTPKELVPVKLEVGLGSQVIKLTPIAKSVPKYAATNYNYSDSTGSNTVQRSATLYFSENTFAINGKVADFLRNAPKGEAKVRITLANGDTKIFKIGEKNVARWKDTFSYNPNCNPAK
jgi:hypothetical protein